MRRRITVSMLGVSILAGIAAVTWPWSRGSDEPTTKFNAAARTEKLAATPSRRDDSGTPVDRFPLLTATSPAEVREVVLYARNANENHIPELRRVALSSPDPLVAGNAIRALGRLGAVAADEHLVALLEDPRPRILQELVLALGVSGDRSALDQLEPLLAKGDPSLRTVVIQALGRLGGPRARRLVESVLNDPGSTELERVFARTALTVMHRTVED